MLNRFISIVLAALMLSSLVGCGTKMPMPSNEEVLTETDDTLMPEENSENPDGVENSQESPDTEVLTNEELSALVKKGDREEIGRIITTAEDAIQLIIVAGIKEGRQGSIESAFTEKVIWPDKIIELVCRTLSGDYEEVGMVTTLPDYYRFLYVKQDGKYCIYDVLQATRLTMVISGGTFDSTEEMTDYAAKIRNAAGHTNCMTAYMTKIGALTFTDEELATLAETGDPGEICRAITTAEDCTQLIAVSGLEEGDNGSIESAFAKKLLNADQIIELACRILDGDYEELGTITTEPNNYAFLYVKQDGKYGIYDVLKAAQTGQGESGVVCDSIEAMIKYTTASRDDSSATMKTWPW
jgi:predicted small lipoprotein YifL